MKSKRIIAVCSSAIALMSVLWVSAGKAERIKDQSPNNDSVQVAVDKGLKWLVSVQGADGGWGQDGGATSYIRQTERLESNGNDVANTAVAAEALLHAGNTPTSGPYKESLRRAVGFILEHADKTPMEGLSITDLQGTQIQRKLGPYIDTFLTSKLLAELDGRMGDAKSNARVRANLEKCVAKIEKNQMKDGSWNIEGGWAPILGTSLASQSLDLAQRRGIAVNATVVTKVEKYTQTTAEQPAAAAAAGVPLYKSAQELEQLTRTPKDRDKNANRIKEINGQLSDDRFQTGFGSIGGEEFFSYLNVAESLRRTGGPTWEKWNAQTTEKILKTQNDDGTWAGHHCITGRVAVTGAAILNLLADRNGK
ncbi:MAG TPA: prenyltransferase/squalene oxidase repeat-containing protein [Bryobacteraceae bacterium]